MKLNNKGFTLVELLAVVVILIAISSIAIPTISSSLERSKNKQFKAKVKLVESAAQLYISDHQNSGDVSWNNCYVFVSTLVQDDYLEEDEDIPESTCVFYNYNDKTFKYRSNEAQCDTELRCGARSMLA